VLLRFKAKEIAIMTNEQFRREAGAFALSFYYKDGRRVDLTWKHPSRAQSWTPEMKAEAARRAKKHG
jgi:hypothetical protein